MTSGKPMTAPDDTSELFDILPTSIDELREKAGKLYGDHYDEIALNKDVMTLSPDWPQYYELELRDRLVLLAAWLGHEMIGYSVSQVCQHLHYRELKFMANDVLFLAKEHRASGVGMQLIDATIDMARKIECEMITFHAKPGTALAFMLSGSPLAVLHQNVAQPTQTGPLGFQVQDIVFSKVL